MTAFTDEYRSFVVCSVLFSFGDCKFFFQTQMALLHPAVVWDGLAEDMMLGEFPWSLAVQYAFESAVACLFLDPRNCSCGCNIWF